MGEKDELLEYVFWKEVWSGRVHMTMLILSLTLNFLFTKD